MAAPNPLAQVPAALKKITPYIKRGEELDKDTLHPVRHIIAGAYTPSYTNAPTC